MLTEGTGVSSKRFCGVIGWIVSTVIICYCTYKSIEAPQVLDTFLYCIMGLLSVSSVVKAFNKQNK